MTRPPDRRPQALLIAAFDSQLKWVAGIRDELVARGFDCPVVVPAVRSALSPGQIAAAGFVGVESVAWTELLDRAASSQVVVCGLSGPFTLRFTVDLADRLGSGAGAWSPGPVPPLGLNPLSGFRFACTSAWSAEPAMTVAASTSVRAGCPVRGSMR